MVQKSFYVKLRRNLGFAALFVLSMGNLESCNASGSRIAANTTVQSGISVKTFGARGDGITNDRSAIQKALAKTGSIVYFPAGTYRIDGFIRVADGVKLTGNEGSVIVASANIKTDPTTGSSHQGQIFILGSNSSVQGLKIDGKNFNAGGFCLSKVKNSSVINCIISNTGKSQGIQDYLSVNTKYTGNTITNTLSGIQLWLANKCVISGNKINMCDAGGIWGANAANITCSNNNVKNSGDVGIDWEGGQLITVKGNMVSSCNNGELAIFKTSIEGNQQQENIFFINNITSRTATYLNRKGVAVACSSASGSVFISSVSANCKAIVFKANTITVKSGFAFFTNDITQPKTNISFTDNIVSSADKFFRVQGTDGLLIKFNNFKGLAGAETQSNEFKNATGIILEGNTFNYDVAKTGTTVLTWFTDRQLKGERPLLVKNKFVNTADLALKHDPYISGMACILQDNALTGDYTPNGGVLSTGNGAPLYINQTLKTKVRGVTRELLLNTLR
jgi:parallel beta-helix repeat protein